MGRLKVRRILPSMREAAARLARRGGVSRAGCPYPAIRPSPTTISPPTWPASTTRELGYNRTHQIGGRTIYAGTLRSFLKGHGNEADFLGFLQKLVPHRSLTLPFWFRLRIRRDIRKRKTTPRLDESAFECLKENSASRRVSDSPTRRVGESLWWVGE